MLTRIELRICPYRVQLMEVSADILGSRNTNYLFLRSIQNKRGIFKLPMQFVCRTYEFTIQVEYVMFMKSQASPPFSQKRATEIYAKTNTGST